MWRHACLIFFTMFLLPCSGCTDKVTDLHEGHYRVVSYECYASGTCSAAVHRCTGTSDDYVDLHEIEYDYSAIQALVLRNKEPKHLKVTRTVSRTVAVFSEFQTCPR